ncbi:MAG TPA: AgmX/PglI C-terminal domain-containing protein [Myxococcaceae bacterium]|nr:AgmX/PglI C-terminal domain-containing protein [Myxococcaceae bacterium]
MPASPPGSPARAERPWDARPPAPASPAPTSGNPATRAVPAPTAAPPEPAPEPLLVRPEPLPGTPVRDEPPSTLSREEVLAAVRGAERLVRECFEDAQDRFPGPGRVTLRFTLEGRDGSGRITGGEVVEAEMRDPVLEACFLDALVDAQFPTPEGTGTLTVQYPFRFDPHTDGGTKRGG